MLKKRCFAALSGILLAISVIAPFCFSKVYASTGILNLYDLYSFDRGAQYTNMYCDLYYIAKNLVVSHKFVITINSNFRVATYDMPFSYALIESDGNVYISETRATTGSGTGTRTKQILEIELVNVSYFHLRIENMGTTTYWDANAHAPQYWMDLSFSQTTNPQYAGAMKPAWYFLSLIYNDIHNGGGSGGGTSADLTALEDLSQAILDCSEYSNENEETIIQQLEDIKALLGTQPDSPAQDVIDNNDDLNEEAQDVISDYDSLTSTFESNFTDSQEEMTTILQNTSLTQFTDAAVWFTTQLGLLYQSLGDMQILVALPLILGIALFFIGRGNVIFRSPNTETWTETTNIEEYNENGVRQNYIYSKSKRIRGGK